MTDSSDLVERLRCIDTDPRGIHAQAADTIQRLEAEKAQLRDTLIDVQHYGCEQITALQSERDAWRLALENIRDSHTFGIKPSEIARAALAGKD
jgi:hypothetical protein